MMQMRKKIKQLSSGEKHEGKYVYVGIPGRRFDMFLIFLVPICLRCSNKQGNISFDKMGLYFNPNCQTVFRCASSSENIISEKQTRGP